MTQYRIVRLAGLHTPLAEKEILRCFPEFVNWSYDDQIASLFKLKYLYSDSFSRAIRLLGQEAFDIVWDFELTQKQWAKENSIEILQRDWQKKVLLSQLQRIQPQVVYFQGTELAIPGRPCEKEPLVNWPTLIKQEVPSVKLVMMYSGFPSRGDRIKGVDVLLSSPPQIVEHYRRMGYKPILSYHAFDKDVLESLELEGQTTPANGKFTFVGSTRAPESRYWMLKHLMRSTEMNIWIDEPAKMNRIHSIKNSLVSTVDISRRLLSEKRQKFYKTFAKGESIRLDKSAESDNRWLRVLPTKPLKSLFPSRCHSAVRGLEYYRILQQSKVTFNKHTDHVHDSVGNMRMFEATGVGTCLLTDSGSNIKDLFEPGVEVFTYTSTEEAVEKATFLLENEDIRSSIAQKGKARTLRDHTIKNRCDLVDEIIRNLI